MSDDGDFIDLKIRNVIYTVEQTRNWMYRPNPAPGGDIIVTLEWCPDSRTWSGYVQIAQGTYRNVPALATTHGHQRPSDAITELRAAIARWSVNITGNPFLH